jgi:mono/diheme cytochrome c family protein
MTGMLGKALRNTLMSIGLLALVGVATVGCSSKPAAAPEQAASAQQATPAQDANPANPTTVNADSVKSGGALYHSADCALCHGKDGNGKGFEAKDAHLNVHDWRDASYNNSFTDGQLYTLIAKGKGGMPAYETRNTPDQIWLMVDYIRSLRTN